MISRLVVVPHPPLLVPELVSGAVRDTEPVRSAWVWSMDVPQERLDE